MFTNENVFQKWEASDLHGLMEAGSIKEVKTVLKPVNYSQYRKISQIELSRNVESGLVTIKIHASAAAREEGILTELAKSYKKNSQIKEENLNEKMKIKVPVLTITVPSGEVESVLKKASACEETMCKMSDQTIKSFASRMAKEAVESFINTFKKIKLIK